MRAGGGDRDRLVEHLVGYRRPVCHRQAMLDDARLTVLRVHQIALAVPVLAVLAEIDDGGHAFVGQRPDVTFGVGHGTTQQGVRESGVRQP